METPLVPYDEQERLASLERLNILDTEPEERFDRYTRLLQRILEVPIALVSLVDADRQWFKSRQGLNATETPRDVSFCGHAILEDEVFVVEDALKDERFHDNPLVTGDPDIRFYAGFPVSDTGGHRIGTLCAIDRKPRQLSENDRQTLRDLAKLVSSEMRSYQLATTDKLTGLANRRGLMMLSQQALSQATRAGQSATLAMIDLDGLKQINDTLGHSAGDEAIITFAQLLHNNCRDCDVTARLGGDEFCAVLVDADEDDARRSFERLRANAAKRNVNDIPLEFSVGFSVISCKDTDIETAMKAADEKMYIDKRRRKAQALGSE